MALLTCDKLSVGYDGKMVADNISFCVEKGDFICVVGENGSGKSTLIKGILGLLPLKNGRIIYNGMTKKEMGYLPQQTLVQKDFPACVYEVVLSGFLNRKGLISFYNKADKAEANENLKKFGIYDLKKKSYRELSGGQQQRVLLCRAFCSAQKVMFLDEPVTGLDIIATRELYTALNELCRDGMAVVMITHGIEGALEKANKILHMDESSYFFGATNDYINSKYCRKLIGD